MGNETVRGLLREYADYLTAEQVAEVLGVTTGTVYQKLASGDLAGFQIGRYWRIPPSELERFVERERQKPRRKDR